MAEQRVLAQIELAFNGHPNVLYEAIANGMHGGHRFRNGEDAGAG